MSLMKKYATCLVIFLVLSTCCLQEIEATRRVNRGRRTLTRQYYSGLGIPGWVVIVLVAVGQLLIGAVLYLILYKVIITKETDHGITYTPAPTHDPTPSQTNTTIA